MDLNQLELSPFLLQSLYGSSLVDMTDSEKSTVIISELLKTVETEKRPKSLGKNSKNILLVVFYPDTVFLPDSSLQFLMGILGACKLSMEDVALINFAKNPDSTYAELLKEFKPRNLFLFGIEPLSFGLPMDFPAFQAQPFSSCTFLHAPSLEELNEDKVLKSKLWVSLRRIFGI